tara:strand:- start:505 stop:3066 length:2562 start_codon:yes stop_codon:yes gene_type:complete
MQQYKALKSNHQDSILFFRVGDFYEMFYDDAVYASKILDIALTSRDKNKADQVPLCGIPYHAAPSYIAKLLKGGHKVALCEQTEDAKLVKDKRPVRREVIRVYTPGTLLESELLATNENNYLAALAPAHDRVGLAYLDLSTGEFRATELIGHNLSHTVMDELTRLDPRELLLPDGPSHPGLRTLDLVRIQTVNYLPSHKFDETQTKILLSAHILSTSQTPIKSDMHPVLTSAAGALLGYVKELQPRHTLSHITNLRITPPETTMVLDTATQQNLELVHSVHNQTPEGSLRHAIDRTLTPMGSRMLRSWMVRPLISADAIQKRQDAITEFYADLSIRTTLRERLDSVYDLERVTGRISTGVANARDLLMLKRSLSHLPTLSQHIADCTAPLIQEHATTWDSMHDIHEWIESAIQPEVPMTIREGDIIRDGYNKELDELRTISRDGKTWIAKMEATERANTGIDSLKIKYNQVFGYAIEISRANLAKVPEHFVRRQTLVNAERFVTPELKELEGKVLSAGEKIRALELELFNELRAKVEKETTRIQTMAHTIALLDVITALAQLAQERRYVKPEISDDLEIRIQDGRHPVIEQSIGPGTTRPELSGFIPNDVWLNDETQRMLIITGPNMAGKSTYLRQVAHIVILAQMGSFVPARAAKIGIVDRIFTRIGASDNLTAGLSTFMVEMTETANILDHATSRSLILLDEVGRGTSTFDGLSIAWAVAEHIHTYRDIQARTLFATHYHELTELPNNHSGMKNYHIAVQEKGDAILFLRKIVEGKADRSYGIHVAQLAGLPIPVIVRAKEILAQLEGQSSDPIESHPDQTANSEQLLPRAILKKSTVHNIPDNDPQMGLF